MWVERKPNIVPSLAEMLPRYRTDSCRDLAEGFGRLMGAGGEVPAKHALDLTAFTRAIPHLALCAIIKPDRCIYRITGEALKARHGFNATGRNYYDFVPEERRHRAIRAMHMVIDVPCGFRAEIEQRYSDGRDVTVEATGFPLRSTEPGVDGFILFADEQIDRTDRLLDHDRTFLGANVVTRDLVDLGHGVDAGFTDLVALPEDRST